jgi:hypothetical protein
MHSILSHKGRLKQKKFASFILFFAANVPAQEDAGIFYLIAAGSMPLRRQKSAYSSGEISLGLISLRPPQKTLV